MTSEEIKKIQKIIQTISSGGDVADEDATNALSAVVAEVNKMADDWPLLSTLLVTLVSQMVSHDKILEEHAEKLELLRGVVVDSGCVDLAHQNKSTGFSKLDKTMIN